MTAAFTAAARTRMPSRRGYRPLAAQVETAILDAWHDLCARQRRGDRQGVKLSVTQLHDLGVQLFRARKREGLHAAAIPAPSLDLHRQVRAGFIAQGTSLNKWCEENSILPSNARDVLIGRWNGPKGQELRSKIAKASGARRQA